MSTRTVGAGKTYSTIQAALDALYVAVGGTTFTETQTIEVYDGTYTEQVTPNANLKPTAVYRLVMTAATGNAPVVTGSDVRTSGFYVDSINYVTITGFIIINTTGSGIFLYAGTYGILNNNTCYSNTSNGIRCQSANALVYSNTCYSNGVGIYVSVSSVSIYGNTVYSNTAQGIYCYNSATCIIYGNYSYSNTVGISCESGSGGHTVYNNICYSNSSDGIIFWASDSGRLYNNTLYLNDLQLGGVSTNAIVKNNIISRTSGNCLYVRADSVTGFVSNNNDFHKAGSANVANYNGSTYSTLALYQAASSQDANSISADPLFVDSPSLGADYYKLQRPSPCRRIGADLSGTFTTDYYGLTRRLPWHLGAIIANRDFITRTVITRAVKTF